MSKNNFEILTEVYSGTSIGERIKKREQVISDYLNVYGQLILNKVLKPTPVMEHLAKKYNFSRCGVLKILKEAGIYHGRSNPVVYPSELNNKQKFMEQRIVFEDKNVSYKTFLEDLATFLAPKIALLIKNPPKSIIVSEKV